jgi:hypothetical protein
MAEEMPEWMKRAMEQDKKDAEADRAACAQAWEDTKPKPEEKK